MGYQITFAPTEEKMKEYKPWNEKDARENLEHENTIKLIKREIRSYCMKDRSSEPTCKIAAHITSHIRALAYAVKDSERDSAYFRWLDEEDHTVWYCGWQNSRESDFEEGETIDRFVDDLLVLADIVTTPDYFDDEERFYKKLNDIDKTIDGAIEIFQDIYIHQIIDDLKPFDVSNKEDEDENEPEEMEEPEPIYFTTADNA